MIILDIHIYRLYFVFLLLLFSSLEFLYVGEIFFGRALNFFSLSFVFCDIFTSFVFCMSLFLIYCKWQIGSREDG